MGVALCGTIVNKRLQRAITMGRALAFKNLESQQQAGPHQHAHLASGLSLEYHANHQFAAFAPKGTGPDEAFEASRHAEDCHPLGMKNADVHH